MAENVIEIVVKTTDKTKQGFDDVEKKAKGLKSSMGEIGKVAGGFIAANVVAGAADRLKGFVGDSITAAKDLGESVNAVDKVFGNSSKEIQAWGAKNANSLGLSQRAFNQLATPLGAMLKNAGLGMKDTTKWTEDLTERAADMASVFNVDVSESMEAIQAGLRGESDPLEKFGVSLSAAKVEAEAMAMTGKKSASSLTDQEKATARLNLIMKQTKDTAGDFRGTSDDLANAQRIAAAKTEEMQAKIGRKMIPVAQKWTEVKLKLVSVLSDKLVPGLDKVGGFVKEHAGTFKVLALVIGGVLVAAFGAWAVSAASAAVATIAATWPILAIGAAIGALVAGILYAYKHWGWFREIVDKVAKHLKTVVWPAIKTIATWLKEHVPDAIRATIRFFGNMAEKAADVARAARRQFNGVVEFVRDMPGKMSRAFSRIFHALVDPIDRAVRWAKGKLRELVDYAKGIPGRVADSFGGVDWTPWNAHGGIIGGAATGGARGGLTWVGERGAELVRLPFGSTVHSAEDSARMAGQAAGGSAQTVILRSDGSEFMDAIVKMLRKAVRDKGGNVQFVLGS